jgi:hypothetical protein
MSWATVSIGDLLSRVAPGWVSYTVAGVFDLAWIVCMVLEWLARNDPRRAALPRKAGWAALTISMLLITLHGRMEGFLAIGIGGALVSFIAKSMWSVVMGFTAVRLSEESLGWLQAEREEVGTELAMTHERRKLIRERDKIETERRALGQDTAPELPSGTWLSQDETPLLPEPAVLSEDEKTKAVRALARAMDIPVNLFGLSETRDRTPATAPAVRDRTPATVVHLDRLGRPSVQSTVNKLYQQDPDMDGTDVRLSVRSVHGQDTSESSIAKAITRSPYRRTGTE